MTIAYISVLIVILLPVVWVSFAKKDLFKQGVFNNNASRPQVEAQVGMPQRANWAQQNSYEALPGFIAAVIIAHLAGASQVAIDILAVVHVTARVLYGICYLKDWGTARSLVWAIGFFATIGLFVAAF